MIRRFDPKRSVYVVSRRDLYLLVWGGMYLILGSYVMFMFEDVLWTAIFWVAGMSALLGSLYNSMWKKAAAFALLAAVSALRAISFATPYIWNIDLTPDVTLGIALLYLGISFSHVVVAGWHDNPILETADESEKFTIKGD